MMNDPIQPLFLQRLQADEGVILVVLDEHFDDVDSLPIREDLHYVSNRFELAEALSLRKARIDYNDFDLSQLPPGHFSHVVYRISKEKALVHHIINQAGRVLSPGGSLHLLGHKDEGLKTYREKAATYLGGGIQTIRGKRGYSCASITRDHNPGTPLEDNNYPRLRRAVAVTDGLSLYSKPGIYGWRKVDRGSQLLIELATPWLQTAASAAPLELLDLGCGYGYLAVMAAQLCKCEITATDNNCAAISACKLNLHELGIDGRAIASDCGAGIDNPFDLILCNPPFHQGFATHRGITARFVQRAAAMLNRNGAAFFVVNAFVDIEDLAKQFFGNVECLDRQQGFKVLRFTDPTIS